MSHSVKGVAGALLILVVSSSIGAETEGVGLPWTLQQPGYAVEIVASGFRLPVNIAFVPNPGPSADDPFYYVTELRGTIKVVTRAGEIGEYATGLLNYAPPDSFPGPGEQGLTGIVVDPATGDLYVSMLYDSASDPGTHYPKIVHLTSDDGGRTAATETVILDMVGESQGQSHQVSTVTVGPDGKLYVHNGDGFATSTAQNLSSYRGKILRMNLDGSPAEDNPFYDPGGGDRPADYVFAYGVRNPFGGAWRSADGKLYEVENGPSVDRFAQVVAGRNFMWSGSNSSMSHFAIYNWNPATGPVNLAFVQPETYGGSGFAADTMDHAFVSESGHTYASGPQIDGKKIVEFVLDAAGELVSGPTTLVEYSGTGKATVVALAAGPDGLYFSDFYKDQDADSPIDPGANILRIRSLSVPRLGLTVDRESLEWDALDGVTEYDVLRGDLIALRGSGGDFTQAGAACLENDFAGTLLGESDDPPDGGFWYLVRELYTAGSGSYESGGTAQIDLRDSEIAAAPGACP